MLHSRLQFHILLLPRYTKDSTKFVFLLCTRAGGVGINLTAADTCIIFDSDWNPQNDIQAQARCHRIGQTRKVQVYRLITANTYEQHMFDMASKKLGLDRAVLGTMTSTVGKSNSDASKMNKKEVESLLKHGAYHVFLSNTEETSFCADNIENILTTRSRELRYSSCLLHPYHVMTNLISADMMISVRMTARHPCFRRQLSCPPLMV